MLEPAVDRLGGSVAGPGPVEVGEHIDGSLPQRPAEGDELSQRLRHPRTERLDHLSHQLAALGPVWLPVGGDHALVDAPGRLDLDVLIVGEQPLKPNLLPLGEQVEAGV